MKLTTLLNKIESNNWTLDQAIAYILNNRYICQPALQEIFEELENATFNFTDIRQTLKLVLSKYLYF